MQKPCVRPLGARLDLYAPSAGPVYGPCIHGPLPTDVRVEYQGDRDMYCNDRKCRKRTRHKRCPNCDGHGGGATTHCAWCKNSGYKCENGMSDKYHY